MCIKACPNFRLFYMEKKSEIRTQKLEIPYRKKYIRKSGTSVTRRFSYSLTSKKIEDILHVQSCD
jgi:hypothetical protein